MATRKEVIEEVVENVAAQLQLCASNIDDFAVGHKNLRLAIEYRKLGIRAREVAADFVRLVLDDDSMTEPIMQEQYDGTEG